MSTLSGKVAIVTGGSRGIGLATARLLRREGASVAVVGTNSAHLRTAVDTLTADEAAGRVEAVAADVRDSDQMEAAMARTASALGGIDIVINNAGVGIFKPVAEMSVDEWRLMFDTNITGIFNTSRAALPYLRARGGGWVINVSSLSGTNPFPGGAAYCATKAAVNAFSEAFMQEVRHNGIRVAYVAPGSVDTSFGGGARDKSGWALQPEDVAQVIGDLVAYPGRSLPSRVEIRPSRPPRKG
jgi:NAD(P)-dependent dehydrogenase (short-subunit alcohol dehydrogenase family)